MIVAADLGQLAELAFALAEQQPSRSPERRAASHLWVSLTVPPVKTIAAAKKAIESFGPPATRQAALELLHQLAATEATPPATGEGRCPR